MPDAKHTHFRNLHQQAEMFHGRNVRRFVPQRNAKPSEPLPTIEPTARAYAPFPDNDNWAWTRRSLERRLHEQGARWFRDTRVERLHDSPGYPLGIYVEGWTRDPAKMEPPHRPAPFNFPLEKGEPVQTGASG